MTRPSYMRCPICLSLDTVPTEVPFHPEWDNDMCDDDVLIEEFECMNCGELWRNEYLRLRSDG